MIAPRSQPRPALVPELNITSLPASLASGASPRTTGIRSEIELPVGK
jgi:hypothetical protein